jgi:hypothetical protein
MKAEVLHKPANQILKLLTKKSSIDSALPLAMKDLLRLKIRERQAQVKDFEKKYGMTFTEYEQACMDGRIENPYSYEIEKDGWDWEALITEIEDFEEMAKWLA